MTIRAANQLFSLAVLLAALVLVFALRPGAAPELSFSGSDGEPRAEQSYGSLPLAFEPNAGRGDQAMDFSARSGSGTTHLRATGAALTLGTGRHASTIELNLRGANPADPVGLERLPGVVNDLTGDDPSKWEKNLPTFERVRYPDVYPGVSLDWYGDQRNLEYDFRLAPGADPRRIELGIAGARDVRLAANGELVIDAGRGDVRQRAPVAYQPTPSGRQPVSAGFTLEGRTVGFRLGAYDRSRPLVIDPLVLSYSTYLGATGFESGDAIALDATRHAYVTGLTGAADFNVVGGIPGETGPGGSDSDVYVSKLTPGGGALEYSTYLGGSGDDAGNAIAVDSVGAAYVTGRTESTDFNTTPGALQVTDPDAGANADVFVSKLAPGGGSLEYSTYVGGSEHETSSGIALDPAGNAYVAGQSGSTDFNTTTGALQVTDPDAGANADGFVFKLNAAGSALAYSTYLGGSVTDVAGAIAVDSDGRAYVTGFTGSGDFPVMNEIEGDDIPTWDTFLTKLTSAGDAVSYSTYLGGNGEDRGNGVAIDASGNAYVAGQSVSTDFNLKNQIEGDSIGMDAIVYKVNTTAAGQSSLVYSTYLGGNGEDKANAVAIDSAGGAYVTGGTFSSDFDRLESLQGNSVDDDAFISKLTPSGALAYSTYFGGSAVDGPNADEQGNGIAVDGLGDAYVIGNSDSSDLTTVGPIEGDQVSWDAFILKLNYPGPTDTDGDGVRDSLDSCPTQSGPVSNGGCPLPAAVPSGPTGQRAAALKKCKKKKGKARKKCRKQAGRLPL